MLSRRRGQDIPGPERGNLFLTKDAVELSSRCGDLILHHRQQRLSVRQDDAILQELGAGWAAEGRLIGPSLIERGYLNALLDSVELTF
jgi:hypothetical protein